MERFGFRKIKEWIRKNKFEFFLLLLILLLASFLRLWRIYDFAVFLGDEGRDALVVKKMIVEHRFTLLGPMTSVGNMYLGPVYYYMMIIPLWLTRLDPVGPAMMVAIIGVLTVLLIYLTGRDFFDKLVGLTAALLYAVSPLVISHTRSSWNPNPMPFFALLAIYSLFKAIKNQDRRWLMVLGLSLGITTQLHYMSLILIGSIFLFLLILRPKFSLKDYFLLFISFVLVLVPQILFELRHDFVISKSIITFLKEREVSPDSFSKLLACAFSLYKRLFTSLIGLKNRFLGNLLALFSGALGFFILVKEREFLKKNLGLTILFFWITLGVLELGFYRGDIHDHYFGFLFPAPFLLFSSMICFSFRSKIGLPIGSMIVFFLFLINLRQTPFFAKENPGYHIRKAKEVARLIANDADNQKFNLIWISPVHDYLAMNYRYFLDIFGKPARDKTEFTDIEFLYVIMEGNKLELEPEKMPFWEIKSFGPAIIDKEWQYDSITKIYKLKKAR